MLEIIKAMTGIVAMMTIFTTIIYFSFSVGLYEMLSINKVNSRDSLKVITAICIGLSLIIIFIVNFSAPDILPADILPSYIVNKSNENTIWKINTKIYGLAKNIELKNEFYLFLAHFVFLVMLFCGFNCYLDKIRSTEIFSCKSYKNHPKKHKWYMLISMLIICISSCFIWYEFKEINVYYMYKYIMDSEQTWITLRRMTPAFEFLVLCVMTALASGMIYSCSELFNFKRYIIGCDRFQSGKVIAYIIAETEKELMIKCEDSYPIILKRDLVEGYIVVDEKCILDEDGELNFPDEDKKVYKGYMISGNKSNSKSDIEIMKNGQ
jgi:hypothetical protein